ncbi:MAG TPA: prenyltransferase [Candidatus Aminicenantes bacterium]|nr:prenyltransferase [Candidatus Aminicenantes bacterium]
MPGPSAPTAGPSPLGKWMVAVRPWSFPASTMPILYGTALAVAVGGARLSPGMFLWALATMVVLHAAANMLSDVFDFRRGLDRDVTPLSGAIVRGWLTDRQEIRGSAVLFALGAASGLLIARRAGWSLLVIGGIGIAVGAGYSLLKVDGLGDLAVFLDFGLLGAAGAWVVQARSFSWLPVIWATPIALLVVAILHANNWRDIASDGERRVRTLAGRLGDRGSLAYYGFLIFAPFVIDIALMAVPRVAELGLRPMPLTFGVVLLALPSAIRLWGRAARRAAPRRALDFIMLDGATANHNLVFGLLSTAAAVLEGALRWG